jgi:hypothetical protein
MPTKLEKSLWEIGRILLSRIGIPLPIDEIWGDKNDDEETKTFLAFRRAGFNDLTLQM